MIQVTKAYLPDRDKYKSYIDKIFSSACLTNNGELLQTLENRLAHYLQVKNVICVANGAMALQLAYKALGLSGEVITTPFSFAATTSTLVWEGLVPIFADIDSDTFNLDPNNIEPLISAKTSAIVPVHVFGNPCEVEAIQNIATKHNLKVIYDAAHAFGSLYTDEQGETKSVLNYGDISILSFHATKLFHTIEGGAVITDDDNLARKIRLLMNFGISGPLTVESVGINAKMNEFEAAMGLCVLDEIESIRSARKLIWDNYREALDGKVEFQKWNLNSSNNHAYAPVLFKSEAELLAAEAKLRAHEIIPRRYFYPSLDTLDYLNLDNPEVNSGRDVAKVSRSVANRVLCLPIYPTLKSEEQDLIIQALTAA